MDFVYLFDETNEEILKYAGGKGASLCKMKKLGINVPDGFVILSTAFNDNKLKADAIKSIEDKLSKLPDVKLAVRSSALSEDTATTSFAGEFETILDVDKKDVIDAVKKVASSTKSIRVAEYSKAHGLEDDHKIAVVVQILIKAAMSGVTFSCDPITGSHLNIVGNFVYGTGEQLVSGDYNAYEFKISRLNGKYVGEKSFAPFSKAMYKTVLKIENIFNSMEDIEWAVYDENLYILQARPITTLQTINYDTYEVNQSLDTDALWTSNNVSEAVPDVMSPFTFSILHEMDLECQKVPGYFMFGNICGRCYTNISVIYSALGKFGYNIKNTENLMSDAFGFVPKNIKVPIYPFKFFPLLKEMISRSKQSIKRMQDSKKNKAYYLEHTSTWYKEILKSIDNADSKDELLELWDKNLRPYLSKLWYIWFGGAGSATLIGFRKKLVSMVGEEKGNLLCSNFSGSSGSLSSMKPLLCIEDVINGKMTKEEYSEKYGHRSPHEFEVYYEYPGDDPNYIENQIKEFKESALVPQALLKNQKEVFEKTKREFINKYPNKEKWLNKKLETISNDANTRESLRNEFIKVFRAMRQLLLKIGKVCNINDDIFMVYGFEISKLLKGDTSFLKNISKRKENFERYQKYPIFPQFIRGRFNPDEWINSKDRRQDYFDINAEPSYSDDNIIKGLAGAPGNVTGVVHVLHNFEEANDFKKGEILVTSLTNIGWTPMFPKASAIVTDIGAPLSHAAIVARELGIPAVVGCGNGTTLLKTGDRVMVNGSLGIVTKI
ncbi:MAG: PEP-utilizing enzyme [Oscillospiraceae bacterium]|nr:PEP-utilizing enzyme [Oscillospiraceae bacterium]